VHSKDRGVMARQALIEKNLYAVLGVSCDADQDTIKKAYRALARCHHPDINSGNPASEQQFKRIAQAYAVLSDPKRRAEYDAVFSRVRHRAGPASPFPPEANGSDERIAMMHAWSLTWWAPFYRPPAWWVQLCWAPLWSSPGWRG